MVIFVAGSVLQYCTDMPIPLTDPETFISEGDQLLAEVAALQKVIGRDAVRQLADPSATIRKLKE